MSDKLSDLKNIGNVIENQLIAAGIKNADDLRRIGSQSAFLAIRKYADPTACLRVLYSLQGAIENVKEIDLAPRTKYDLKEFYYSISK